MGICTSELRYIHSFDTNEQVETERFCTHDKGEKVRKVYS